MALKKCPECGRKFSYKLTNCPNCGYIIVQKPIWKSIFKIMGMLFSLLTFIGLIAGLWTAYTSIFVPIISITETHSLNPEDPFATQFVISNDGPVTIRSISIDAVDNNVLTTHRNTFSNNHIIITIPVALYPGQKLTLPFPFRDAFHISPEDKVTSADITFSAKFLSNQFPWSKYIKNFRFVTQLASNGDLYWFPQPAISN